jgi:PAS domain S-box-containing protein
MVKKKGSGAARCAHAIDLDAIADRVAVVDLQGRILDVNQAMLDLRKLRHGHIVGRHFTELVGGEDRERLAALLHELVRGRSPVTFDMKSVSPAGRESYSEVKATLVRDANGSPLEVVAIIRDVTPRKEIERRLAESEELYRSLLDSIHEAIYKIDAKGTILFISAGVERVIGYRPEEVVGRNFLEFIWPEDVEFIRSEFQLLAENRTRPSEYRVRHRDGGQRWISSSSRPIFSDGLFRGVTGVLIDIHERKMAQQQLERQKGLLLQAQKMEAIGTLAGGIAHEFNNLLMGIEGRVSLMLLDSPPGQPGRAHLKGIEEQVRSAAELTRQLLGLARGGKYEVRPTDLNELVRRAVDMFGRTRKDIVVSARLEPQLWTVEVDRSQIEQVLINLMVNAGQAMPEGGPLRLDTQNLEVADGDAQSFHLVPGRFVRLSVSDEGTGMEEEARDRVFEPFFSAAGMGHGAGLGLASAYGIVKNHGGIISVYSEKGSGTTFHVYLPATTRAVEPLLAATEEAPRGSETVLLIDDEEIVLDVSRQMLESLGYRVFMARSGPQALDVLRANRDAIDLVILDMIMPGMGGGKVFDALREEAPQLRILLSSGYSINGQAMEIMSRGCRGFIQKPFGIKELAQKLRQVLA